MYFSQSLVSAKETECDAHIRNWQEKNVKIV